MTILHALWSADDRLQVWGERSLTGGRLPRPRGRAAADGRPRRHPYALRGADLREQVVELTGSALVPGQPVTEATLELPSNRDSPLPSPGLPGADESRQRGDAAPAPRAWRADAVEAVGADALGLLLAVPTHAPPRVRPGASLVAAARLALLAVEFAARGRVVPGLVTRAGRPEARWLPVLDAGERRRLAALAAAMTPALLAAAGEDHRTAGAVLREMTEQLVDAACRGALAAPPRRDATGRGSVAGRKAPHQRRGVDRPDVGGRGGVEQAWLRALSTPDATVVHDDLGELQVLAKELEQWHRSGQRGAPMRVGFRLDPPPAADETWQLEFVLQATDDPSLIVPAEQVWSSPRTLRFLDQTLEAPQERLLGDLGRACRLYPQLERALATARPTALDLALDEVVAFLRDTAPLLEQAGFGVALPDELRHPPRLGARLRTTTRSSAPGGESSGLLGFEGIVDYRWEVALGDESITAEELTELVRLKAPLVRLRGRWVELHDDDLAAALRLLRETPTGEMAVADVARIGLGVTDPDVGLEVVDVAADGPLGALLDGEADRRIEPLSTPADLAGQLRAYQERGLSWLAFLDAVGLGGCLADDMGLGKSIQVLALLVHERAGLTRRSRRWPGPTLLVCPISIVGNWEREAQRFAPTLAVHVHHGRERLDGAALAAEVRRADLVITTYSLAGRDHDDLAGIAWRRIVLDEAQNIKNPAARQTRAIRALQAPQRLALTGTPVENRLTELWSIMDFCNPGFLDSRTAFRERFVIPIERLRDDDAAARLRRVTRPFVLRRHKTDRTIITDLPDKIEFDDSCNLTREQASLYGGVVEDMMHRIEESEGMRRRGLVLQTMLRLKQVCNHPAHLLGDGSRLPGRSGKLDRLDSIVDEALAGDEKLLVFTQFAAWGTRLQTHLRDRLGREVLWLHGGVGKAERDRMVAAFQEPGGPGVFVLSLKAGGVGLNLTAASHVVHYDRWWNPAVEDQATDRAFRIGQRRDVVVRRLVCVGTLEERIAALIEHKKDLADRVLGSGEGWLTELSTDELRRVVALGADAVAE